MKLLWIAPYPNSKIADSHPAPWIINLAQSLSNDANIELTIADFDSTIKQNIEREKRGKINFIYLKAPNAKLDKLTFFLLRISALKNFISKELSKFDVVHIHGTEHQYEQGLLNKEFPSVVSMQGIMTENVKVLTDIISHQYFRWKLSSIYEMYAIPKLKNFICRTNYDKSFIKNNNPTANIYENWEMIRNEFFTYDKLINGEKILFVGGINIIKGIIEVLKAINILNETHEFKLIILGYGSIDSINQLKIKYKLNNLSENSIELRGFQNTKEILAAYDECFCLLHPSHIDNSPNSICEAQVAGLPVIASAVGGIPSLIFNDETGIITDLNPRQLANKIIELYESKATIERISNRSRVIARKRHDRDTILSKTIDIYNKIR